ncbi:hypothetical protein L537_3322 [Bordetella hinzii 1277]|nr:hypothetical protein L543_2957 [Bordetella hinzii L60]KCB47867.1 hypothetical protein L538_3117 [Bordetella hinzii 4161]KCB52791.1 hypothetical protein L537_3322 [Bordetella hinzii 1277]
MARDQGHESSWRTPLVHKLAPITVTIMRRRDTDTIGSIPAPPGRLRKCPGGCAR